MLWLSTNSIGTVLLAIYAALTHDWVALTPIVGFFAAGISLPVIPASVVIFNKILAQPTKTARLAWSALAVTSLFALALGLAGVLALQFQLPFAAIAGIAAPFYVAALVAVCLEYKPWLFRNGA